ncbi:tRNA pseudouridine(13) synthase TruD [Aliarcobacter butzleri]|nr:tRNA pseudouridine(13) synthase TruD [Aliarcobacter butzleri]
MIKRFYPSNDKTLNFKFIQNEEDFIVEEQPIKFSLSGNFLVLKIKKTNCDTWELIDRIAKFLNVYSNEIGYAGLKDKRATTTQYITIPKKYSKEIKNFRSKK